MTARVCPVHGEYAADGVCRWCEPEVDPFRTIARVAHIDVAPSPPSFRFAGDDAIAVHWILDFTPAICPEDLIAARNAELAAEHAALRWERVARRWANKHGPWTLRDFAQHWQFFLNKPIALQFKRIAEIGHPLLLVPPEEPKT